MKSSADAIIRACYKAYETQDRTLIEELLTEDFTFSSPLDDNISRERYFERCWPNSGHLERFDILNLLVEGDHAFVRYQAHASDGSVFRNTEFFTLRDGKISHVDVFFGSEDGQAATEDEVRALVEATAEACRAKDATALMALYTPEVMAFDLINPLRYEGSAEVGRRVQAWFDSFEGAIGYEFKELKVVAAGEAAFCHSLNCVRGTKKADGQKIEMWWRSTLGCQKIDGRWRISHAHSSEPFDMETGKASLGLKP